MSYKSGKYRYEYTPRYFIKRRLQLLKYTESNFERILEENGRGLSRHYPGIFLED
jgi:hypothetical protein